MEVVYVYECMYTISQWRSICTLVYNFVRIASTTPFRAASTAPPVWQVQLNPAASTALPRTMKTSRSKYPTKCIIVVVRQVQIFFYKTYQK
jgi:hypothetical protein